MKVIRLTMPLLVVASLIRPSDAAAQRVTALLKDGHGMAQSLFDPAVDTKGHITIDGSPVLPHMAFSIGLMLDFGFNSWLSVEQTGLGTEDFDAYQHAFLSRMITARFQGNFGLWDRVAVGMQIPLMVPMGEFYKLDPEGNQTQSYWSNRGTFGDLSLHIKGHLLRSDWHPLGIAFIIQYMIPSGKSEYMTGDPGGGTFAFKAVIDAEPAIWYRVGLNLGIRLPIGHTKDNYLSWNETNTLLFHHGPALYFGLGQSFNVWPGIMDFVLEFYGNQILDQMGNTSYLSMEGLGGLKFYIEQNSYLMAGYAHGIPIANTESGYSLQNMEHRMMLGFCYEPSIDLGVRQARFQQEEDARIPRIYDMDGDGIPDDEDKCPLVPGPPENFGCPYKEKEYVGDASAAATAPPAEDSNVIISQGSLMILKKVHFEYNSDQIMEISHSILNEVADTISKNPQLTGIHIEGHADQRGNDRYNLKLTQRRAAAVYRYLLDRGVPRATLSHQGYGSYCPVNPQNNEAAWEENRRVEFRVVEVNGNSTDVPTGCPEARKHGAR